jgi:hypothetical protein
MYSFFAKSLSKRGIELSLSGSIMPSDVAGQNYERQQDIALSLFFSLLIS